MERPRQDHGHSGGESRPDDKQQLLLQPYKLADLPLSTRIVMAPLTHGRAHNRGHVPNDLMREYYEQRATAGLIISEGVWVNVDGQRWRSAPGIYNYELGAGWRRITDAVHAKGGRIFAQLWHQGSVSDPSFFDDGRLPLAPSAVDPVQIVHVAGGTTMTVVPREMTHADIVQVIGDYRNAARIAKEAGFDGIQLQAGFVYLIQQFIHEPTNRRADRYGGASKIARASCSKYLRRSSRLGRATGLASRLAS